MKAYSNSSVFLYGDQRGKKEREEMKREGNKGEKKGREGIFGDLVSNVKLESAKT